MSEKSARQLTAKKRSLHRVNEHFELLINAADLSAIAKRK